MSGTNSQDKGYTPQMYVNRHYDKLQQFPRGKAWSLDVLPFDRDTRQSIQKVAQRARVIETVGTFETQRPDGTVQNLWSLTNAAAEILAEYEDRDRQELPCGHVGFTNLPDSPFLQCRTCNARYKPEEVQ